jgi:hypothetical protein
VPSLLDSRGAFAGAGSAVSLVAAAVVSLLFATGLVAFTSWPLGPGSSVPSVTVPSAPTADGASSRPSGRATAGPAIVLPAAGAPARRGTARTIAGTGARGGSAATAVAGAAPTTAPASGSAPATGQQGPPAVTRQVTDGVAVTTADATTQIGSTVGGPAGAAIQSTGEQVAQTVRDVGSAIAPLVPLGG